MLTKYTYSIQNDFPNHKVDTAALSVEISKWPILTALDRIDTNNDDCDIWFQDPLSTEDETKLDNVVAAHQGDPLPLEIQEVVTQFEKDDKGLRTWCAFQVTNEDGEAEFCIPIPAPSRYIAYGDCEFEIRHFGDYVKHIEVTDLDRKIAWGIALALDPEASEPVSDATVKELPGEQLPGGKALPNYPSLGSYEERGFPDPMPSNAKGTILPGMAMTFQYGITEAEPVGGYGLLPGEMYFRIVAKKASSAPTLDGQTEQAGYKCQISIDWAEKEE